jgi:hypothetical protein
LALTAQAFSIDQISRALYGYESVTYTWGPANLPSGPTSIFDVSEWNDPSAPDKLVTIEAMQTNNAVAGAGSVQVLWKYDGTQSDNGQGWIDAFPADGREYEVNAPAVLQTSLLLQNNGSAIANFQFNYRVSVRPLTAAEKLMNGYPLSALDLAAAEELDALALASDPKAVPTLTQLQQAIQKGTFPIARAKQAESLWDNRRLGDPSNGVPRHFVVGSGNAATPQNVLQVPSGQVFVLRSIAPEGAFNGVVTVNRDSQTVPNSGYVSVNAQAFISSTDEPFRYWVPATKNIVVQVSAGALGTYPVRVGVDAYALSDLLRVKLGLSGAPQVLKAKGRLGWQ